MNKQQKKEVLAEITQHERADIFIQGRYWKDGKGCVIGCLAKNNEPRHKYLAEKYDVPEILLHLCDSIFEGLDVEESKKWSRRFFTAIPEDTDLSTVWPQFGCWLLVDGQHGVINVADDGLKEYIQIIALNGTEGSKVAARAVEAWEASVASAEWEAMAAWAAWGAREASAATAQADKLIELLRGLNNG